MNWFGGVFIVILCAIGLWMSSSLGDLGISADAAAKVSSDLVSREEAPPSPLADPDLPPSVWTKIVGDSLVSPSGQVVQSSSLKGDFLALYFSASWCPPCKKFLPILKEFYESSNGRVQIVLMGQDQSAASRSTYYKKSEMPWVSTQFDSPLPDELAFELGVRGIPSLVVFARAGSLVTKEGVADIMDSPGDTLSDWSAR